MTESAVCDAIARLTNGQTTLWIALAVGAGLLAWQIYNTGLLRQLLEFQKTQIDDLKKNDATLFDRLEQRK